MDLSRDDCWERLSYSTHGVLATVHERRGVDAVPVVFVVEGDRIVVPVDTVKDKRTTRLQRVLNLERDPRCALLVDRYDDDWTTLWWVRVHGRAEIGPPTDAALASFEATFPAYRATGAIAATITIAVESISGWGAR